MPEALVLCKQRSYLGEVLSSKLHVVKLASPRRERVIESIQRKGRAHSDGYDQDPPKHEGIERVTSKSSAAGTPLRDAQRCRSAGACG